MKLWHFALIALFVLALRLPYLGSPTIHIDEQFYLVVAEKWVHEGAVPYVDIWDRKPIGIFLIYGFAVLLFKNAILGYQILALTFSAATCATIFYIGRHVGCLKTGLSAALIYAVAPMVMEGASGQTPIFYNLFIALAVMLYLDVMASVQNASRVSSVVKILTGCLLFGLALQVKYTCVLEASALSLWLLVVLYKQRAFHIFSLFFLALGMMVVGLVPTVGVGAAYAFAGHWDAFYYANFESIFVKALWKLEAYTYSRRFLEATLFSFFFLVPGAVGLWSIMRNKRPLVEKSATCTIIVWVVAAFVGGHILGNPTRHYFLPTLTPLSLLAALGLAAVAARRNFEAAWYGKMQQWTKGHALLFLTLVVPIIACFVMSYTTAINRGERKDIFEIASYINAHEEQGCLFVYNRVPILYFLSDRCVPSLYVFPNHFWEMSEVRTPGRERLRELERVLAAKPALIFVRRPYSTDMEPESIAILERALNADYNVGMERRAYQQIYYVYTRKH